MRTTPLPVSSYFRTKVLTSYVMAIVSLALIFAAGLSLGVHLRASAWFETAGLMLVGIIPFVVLGILLGHLLTVDSLGPALGGIVALFALLGGSWGPIGGSSGALHDVVQYLPSYWLVQGGKLAIGGQGWPVMAWIVIGVWTLALLRITTRVYRRDTGRA